MMKTKLTKEQAITKAIKLMEFINVSQDHPELLEICGLQIATMKYIHEFELTASELEAAYKSKPTNPYPTWGSKVAFPMAVHK